MASRQLRIELVARVLGWTPEGPARDRRKQWNPLTDSLAQRDWEQAERIIFELDQLEGWGDDALAALIRSGDGA